MNVLISVLKKDGGKFEKAVDFDPSLISLGETVQVVIANATFHEWGSVLVTFDYKEKGEYTKAQEEEAKMQAALIDHHKELTMYEKFMLGIPSDLDGYTSLRSLNENIHR